MMRENRMQKFAYFCFYDFKLKLFSQIKIVALTTILKWWFLVGELRNYNYVQKFGL